MVATWSIQPYKNISRNKIMFFIVNPTLVRAKLLSHTIECSENCVIEEELVGTKFQLKYLYFALKEPLY